MIRTLLATVLALYGLSSFLSAEANTMNINRREFGRLPSAESVPLYTLVNRHGHSVSVTPYGAIITSIIVPDRDGKLGDVVLGYDRLEDYLRESPYFGCVAGRYGNRIASGRLRIDERDYQLAKNDGPNHLHGGLRGFDKRLWQARELRDADSVGLELGYRSPDGEEGYPGCLTVSVRYSWNDRDELRIEYSASADQATVCNLTQHSYFNLRDAGRTPILDHLLQVDADRITPVDQTLIPTGQYLPVADTPFDFRQPTPIGRRIAADHAQLRYGKGYDHNFVLNGWTGELHQVAVLSEPVSGRTLTVATSEPGLQFYSGNFLDGKLTGKTGTVYGHRHGLCLETQHFPDSPNQSAFPSTLLRPGQTYTSTTVYTFGWQQ